MFPFRKKTSAKQHQEQEPQRAAQPCSYEYGPMANSLAHCRLCGWPIGDHAMVQIRAAHNPRQQIITKGESEERVATELMEGAIADRNVPALVKAMTTIAERFEASVRATDAMNRALGDFVQSTVVPLREELKSLRFDLGDRVKASANDLSVYVDKLDKVIWAALRSHGLSDDQIREFRSENGMQPEAPRGHELEAHVAEVEEMRATIESLTRQNRRLIARIDGHWFTPGEADWSYKQGCKCQVCQGEERRIAEARG
jgi:hypothetical protein